MPTKKTDGTEPALATLEQRMARARELRAQTHQLFPEAHEMPSTDRSHSAGRIGKEESQAMQGVIDAMELEPALFASLADEDEGHDPNKLEIPLLRDRLTRHDLYAALAAEFEATARL